MLDFLQLAGLARSALDIVQILEGLLQPRAEETILPVLDVLLLVGLPLDRLGPDFLFITFPPSSTGSGSGSSSPTASSPARPGRCASRYRSSIASGTPRTWSRGPACLARGARGFWRRG